MGHVEEHDREQTPNRWQRAMRELQSHDVKAWYPVRIIMGPVQTPSLHVLEPGYELHVGDLVAAGDPEHDPDLYRIVHVSRLGPGSPLAWYEFELVEHH